MITAATSISGVQPVDIDTLIRGSADKRCQHIAEGLLPLHVLTFAKRIDDHDAIVKVYEEHYNCASESTKSMGTDVKFDEV